MKKPKILLSLVLGAVIVVEPGFIASQTRAIRLEAGRRIIPLPELEKPRQIRVENQQVCFVDERDIVVYSLADGRLLRRIGKRGQGPGEFMMGPLRLTIFPDRLVVGDVRKILFFSHDGSYLGQVMEPGWMGFHPLLPVGKNFVGFPIERRDDGSLGPPTGCIYDGGGKVARNFYGELLAGPPPPPPPGGAVPAQKQDVPLIQDYTDYAVHEDRIYVADSRKGLFIAVFDENGDLLYEIHQEINKIKVPKGYREAALNKDKGSKYWQSYNAVVPEYFPAFFGFKIDGGRIYVITPDQKNGQYEVIVMDLKGKILEKSFRLPLEPNYFAPAAFNLGYDVEENQFIWFVYNEAKEYYELHIH
jgi:hypothetical protein